MKAKKKGAKHKQPVRKWQPPRGYFVMLAVLAAVAACVGVINVSFANRALPGVYVGSVAVQGMTEPEVRQTVQTQAAQLQVVFQDEAGNRTATAAELGVVVDVAATVEQTLLARRSTNPAENLALWQARTVPLRYVNDAGVLKAYIAQHFPKLHVDPKDAQVIFDTTAQKFVVRPGVPGRGFDIKSFESALPDLARNPRSMVLPLGTVPVQPLIGDEAAAKAQKDVNEQIAIKMEFLQDGNIAYTITPAEMAQWVHFLPDTTAGTLTPNFDTAKIEQFVKETIGGKVTQLPIDRKVIRDKTTGRETVIQAGRKGYQIKDIDKLTQAVVHALKNRQNLRHELDIEEAPFKTVTMAGSGRWIEVDLSQQRLTLYLDEEVVGSWLISSGKAATPTQINVGRIYRKYAVKTMTGTINGEYYYVPDIKWVSFFNGGEAIHGTYWHSNFGHPMSHGCINMTEAAAKIVYDFAPIGTKVVVHQ